MAARLEPDRGRLDIAGLQVWCKRHETNILHVDFEGNTPANMRADR